MLVLVSCNAEPGTSDKKGEKSEYNSEGHLTKITVYYESGAKKTESIYDGTSARLIVSEIKIMMNPGM